MTEPTKAAAPDPDILDPAGHRVPIEDGWSLWRDVGLRGTGFSLRELDPLLAPETAHAADALLDAEAAYAAVLEEAKQAVRRAEMQAADSKPWKKLRRGLAKERMDDASSVGAEADALLAPAREASTTADLARAEYDQAMATAHQRINAEIHRIGRDARFREALLWQNPKVLREGVDPLLRKPLGRRGTDEREKELLIAKYLQRYCTKNETIGFFGPMGWAQSVDSGPTIICRPGKGLVEAGEVCFEYLTIHSLALALGRDKDLKPWLAPRLSPLVRIAGNKVWLGTEPRTLSPAQTFLLRNCDGGTLARDIAARAVAQPSTGLATEAEALALLQKLASAGMVQWTAEPPESRHPERALRRTLQRVGDRPLRTRLLGALNTLEAAKERVAAARGNPEALDTALAELETQFTLLTGDAPRRREGEAYGGRGLVFEDCRRDLEARIGPEMIRRLGAPLLPVLLSARWYSQEIARRFSAILDGLVRDLEARSGGGPLDFLLVWRGITNGRPVINRAVERIAADLKQRWSRILAHESDLRRVQLDSKTVTEAARAAFPASGPGFPAARQHAPDIMIAAHDIDAINRGEYQFVLGEVHACFNTLMQPVMLMLHPETGRLISARARDIPTRRILPVQHHSRFSHRLAPVLILEDGFELACNDAPHTAPANRVLRLADLVVRRRDGGIDVETRDGAERFDALEVFDSFLVNWCFREFSLHPVSPYAPRISVGDLIMQRQSWRMPSGELAFAFVKSEDERFLRARDFARARSLPRQLFVRVAGEVKPIYVDFQSPLSVDLFCRFVRRAHEAEANGLVRMSEMLPTLEQAWLKDCNGDRYTSELRIVAVDPEPWRPQRSHPAVASARLQTRTGVGRATGKRASARDRPSVEGIGNRILVIPGAPRHPGSCGDQGLNLATCRFLATQFGAKVSLLVANTRDPEWRYAKEAANLAPMGPVRVRDFDQCVIIGADVFDGSFGELAVQSMIEKVQMFDSVGKPVRLISLSVGERIAPSVLELWKLLPRHVPICVRDPVSYDRIRSLLPDHKILSTADVAFLCEVWQPATYLERRILQFTQNGNVVCINGSLREDRALADLLAMTERLIENSDAQFLFLSHDNRLKAGDTKFIDFVKRRFGDGPRFMYLRKASYPVVKWVVRQIRLTITMRMHLAIAALDAGCPALFFEYHGKGRGLYALFDLPQLCGESLSPNLAEQYWNVNHNESVRRQISARLEKVRDLARLNFAELSVAARA